MEQKENKERQEEIAELKKQLEEQKQMNAKNLVATHKIRGVVNEGEEEHLEKLALLDYISVKKMLETRTPSKEEKEGEVKPEEGKKLSEQVKEFIKQETAEGDRRGWTYLEWYRKDMEGLLSMQKNEPEKYKKLEETFAKEANAKSLKFND